MPTPHFDDLAFDNTFVRAMPADARTDRETRRVPRASYAFVEPTPVAAPRLLAWSDEVARDLGLPTEPLTDAQRDAFAHVLSGNARASGMQPLATRYGGHQFGNWAGQLGDGRAISLGEVATPSGRLELQLKGAGPTPFSRRSDGRAVLRSSLRELLCSEAMHHLGIPTTRALSLVATGEDVARDMFYDGNPAMEPGAIVCRVAPSFLRLGHFEIHASEDEPDLLAKLFEYAVATHYPHIHANARDEAAILAFFDEVATRTARMIVGWQRVGFVHGVMNTDNLSILGLTIDYGPYGFLEPYEPDWTPNTTDAQRRRYRYGNQPSIAVWNLARFAESLLPLFAGGGADERAAEQLTAALSRCAKGMLSDLSSMIGKKMGIDATPDDAPLIQEGLSILEGHAGDFTLFFRGLGDVAAMEGSSERERALALDHVFYASRDDEKRAALAAWLRKLTARWAEDGRPGTARRDAMHGENPAYVPRNWLAQEAIDAATAGDLAPLHRLLDVLKRPYETQEGAGRFAEKRPAWAERKAGCAMLSCSS